MITFSCAGGDELESDRRSIETPVRRGRSRSNAPEVLPPTGARDAARGPAGGTEPHVQGARTGGALDTPAASGAQRVARNSLAPLAANLAARTLSWVLAAVLARTLGPSGTGAYALAVNLWLYASIVADFGLGTWLTREVARNPASARAAVRESLGLRLLLSLAALPPLVGVAGLYAITGMPDGGAVVATVALLGLGLIPSAISAAGTALFNAHEVMTFPAKVQLVSAGLTTLGGVVALLLGQGMVGLGWVSLIVNTLTAAIFAMASARRFFPLSVALHPRRQLALAGEAFPLMLNSLLNNVFFRVDVQVLQTKGSAAVGYYTNAYKVIDAAGAVPSSFVLALFPELSRRAAHLDGQADGLSRLYCLALKLLLVTGLPAAVLITFAAPDVTLWLWGPAFLPDSAVALRVLAWFLPLSFFNGLTQYVLIAAGLQRRITAAFALAAAFNLLANLALIPRYSYLAAAAVTIASEIVLLIPFLYALRTRMAVHAAIVAALRPLPATLAMALVLWTLAAWSRPGAALASCFSYPVMLLATGVFDSSERRVLAGLFPAKWRRLLPGGP